MLTLPSPCSAAGSAARGNGCTRLIRQAATSVAVMKTFGISNPLDRVIPATTESIRDVEWTESAKTGASTGSCTGRTPSGRTVGTPPRSGDRARIPSRRSGHDIVGAIVRRARDLHDLEIVGIFNVLLRDLALIGDAVALPHRHLSEPLEFGAEPAAHDEDQVEAGVVGVARCAAARLELLNGAPDGAADAALGRFREPEIAIFQKGPQALARPIGAVEPRQHDLGLERRHVSSCRRAIREAFGLWLRARYNRGKRTHAGQALRTRFGDDKVRRMTEVRRGPPRPPGEEDDGHASRDAPFPGAPAVGAFSGGARAGRRGKRRSAGAGSLAQPADQARRS